MASFEFTLELNRDIIDSEAKSIKSSCSDATVKMIPTGIDTGYTGTLVEFDREAESLEKAIESAVADIEAVADLRATGITIPAPERDESATEPSDAQPADAQPADAESADAESAEAQPDASTESPAKTTKKPAAKKAAPRKPSTRKASPRKAAAAEKLDPVAAE